MKIASPLIVAILLCTGSGAVRADWLDVTTYVPAQPRGDQADLAGLAPPSNRATAVGSYGDAAFARRPRVGSISRHADRPSLAETRARCPAETPRASYIQCRKVGAAFFRKNYVYTPSYVSAPQVFEQAPQRPTPVLSPITAFFLSPLH